METIVSEISLIETNGRVDAARGQWERLAAVTRRASVVTYHTMAGTIAPTPIGDPGDEHSRRRSVFYIPLFESFENYLPLTPEEKEALISSGQLGGICSRNKLRHYSDSGRLQSRRDTSLTESESDISIFSPERRYRRPLSTTMSSNEALARVGRRDLASPRFVAEGLRRSKPRLRTTTSCEPRYDRIFVPIGGSVSSHKLNEPLSSIRQKSPSKNSMVNSNLSLILDSPKMVSPNKEKSKTLPQNPTVTSPIRGSSSSTSIFRTPRITVTPDSPNKSSGKISGLNFIRRSRSTKLSRSNSLLRSVTSRHVEESLEEQAPIVTDISQDYYRFMNENGGEREVIGALIKKNEEQVANSPISIRRGCLDIEDDVAVHSGE